MSARKTSKKLQPGGRKSSSALENGATPQAVYVYCVGFSDQLRPVLSNAKAPAAIEGSALELIEGKELAAVVSAVPLDDYNEAALEAHLLDAAWTALRAMRHERVVDHFATRAGVVPLRFGTIYVKREGVAKLLAERDAELRASLERLRGREEWGVNVFCDRKVLLESIADLSPTLREMNEQAATAGPGQGYLLRRKMDAMRADEARAETKRTVAAIERELQGQSDGAARLRILKDEAGEHGELVGKLAFLVERARFDEFRRAAESLAAKHGDAGFRLELTGPWPAYNFVAGEKTELV